jgi:hypothetical protein
VLLALTLLVSTISLASGRATALHGTVHLVVFGTFLCALTASEPANSRHKDFVSVGFAFAIMPLKTIQPAKRAEFLNNWAKRRYGTVNF